MVGAPVMGIALLFSLATLAWNAIREPIEASRRTSSLTRSFGDRTDQRDGGGDGAQGPA
jgi:hypothetical protein